MCITWSLAFAHLSHLATSLTTGCSSLRNMFISHGDVSRTQQIQYSSDLLVLFLHKNRPYIALAAASSRYEDGPSFVFHVPSGRAQAMSKAPTYLAATYFFGFCFCFCWFFGHKILILVFFLFFLFFLSMNVNITTSFSI